ncbi:hypothetical protein ALP64_202056 [Pseudomonas syringae pv. actinidiae]|nr:hypothetical protein ALP75_205414 [Pseudomonas syringae pv. actinidiae]RMS58916.1 hypothetical protein ALP64_202056 [Pseudomonas syringae pv. actinidiae]
MRRQLFDLIKQRAEIFQCDQIQRKTRFAQPMIFTGIAALPQGHLDFLVAEFQPLMLERAE